MLILILIIRSVSLHITCRLYDSCVGSGMFYGSETRSGKNSDVKKLKCTDKSMVRCMWNATMKDGLTNVELRSRLELEHISEVMKTGR